jgi:hypothetical protein
LASPVRELEKQLPELVFVVPVIAGPVVEQPLQLEVGNIM